MAMKEEDEECQLIRSTTKHGITCLLPKSNSTEVLIFLGCQEITMVRGDVYNQKHSYTMRAIMKPQHLFTSFLLVVLLAALMGCASTATHEGTGEYLDDSVITTKVKAAIFGDESLKSAEINVETFKGVVQLSGFVNSQAAINKAVEVARTVAGVISVKNDMQLK
jgi:hypothetical protein